MYYFGCKSLQHVLEESNVGVIKPETLPPTEGAAAQHSLRTYLRYGWTVGAHGYELIPTLDPEELLGFTTCNYNGDCSNQRCSCKKNGVKCISACGYCKGIVCKTCLHDDVESGGRLRHRLLTLLRHLTICSSIYSNIAF